MTVRPFYVSEAKKSCCEVIVGRDAGQSVGSDSVVTIDELPVLKNSHGCSESKKFLFRNLGTNPMMKIRLIPLMPEFFLTMCLSLNLSS